jgi:hypothetical protein
MGGLFWSKTGAGASRDYFKAGLVAHREKKARCLLCLALMNTSSDCRDLAKVVEDSLRSSSANISMARCILPPLKYERPSVFFLHKDIKDLLHCVCAKMSKTGCVLALEDANMLLPLRAGPENSSLSSLNLLYLPSTCANSIVCRSALPWTFHVRVLLAIFLLLISPAALISLGAA